MTWVATAIVGSSLISAGVGAYSANKSASAVKNASNSATSTELAMFNQSREDQAPWLSSGENALALLMGRSSPASKEEIFNELIKNGEFDDFLRSDKVQKVIGDTAYFDANNVPKDKYLGALKDQFYQASKGRIDEIYNQRLADYEAGKGQGGLLTNGPGDWRDSPEYDFIREQGLRGIERGASAMGGLRSGAHLKAAGEYTSNLANTQINDYYDRWMQTKVNPLMQIAGLGQNAAANVGNQGVAAGQSIGQNTLTGGLASASGTMGATNSITNNLQWGAGQLLDYYNYNKNKNALTGSRPGDDYGIG